MIILEKKKGEELMGNILHAMKVSAVNICAIPFGVALSDSFYNHGWLTALRVVGFIVVGLFFFGNCIYETLGKKKEDLIVRLLQDVVKGAIIVCMVILLLNLNPIETFLKGISMIGIMLGCAGMGKTLAIAISLEFILPVVVCFMSTIFFEGLIGQKKEKGLRIGKRVIIVAVIFLLYFLVGVALSLGALSFSEALGVWWTNSKIWMLPMLLLMISVFFICKDSLVELGEDN